jgi:hypothetical protein
MLGSFNEQIAKKKRGTRKALTVMGSVAMREPEVVSASAIGRKAVVEGRAAGGGNSE